MGPLAVARTDDPNYWILVTTMERSRDLTYLDREATDCCVPCFAGYGAHHWNSSEQGNSYLFHHGVDVRMDPKATE